MKLTDRVYLVGGGWYGFGLSNDYDSHIYLIRAGEELALVDAGVGIEPERVLANIATDGFAPERISHILLTHAHSDHAGGSRKLKEASGAKVYLSAREAEFLRMGDEAGIALDVARAAGYYPEWYRLEACPVDVALEEGQEIRIGDLCLTAIAIPGHSIGSLCYLMEAEGKVYLFSGDVVFWGGEISLLNCRGSSLEDYRENIGKLAGLGVDILLPGHGAIALSQGQRHVDRAVKAFEGLAPPKNFL